MADKKIIPASRGNRLRRLGGKHGQEYAVVRNGQIQAGQEARDYLKEFSVYIGCDGKSSRSAVDKETGDHRESGGNVHVAVTVKSNRILGGSVKEADKTGNMELIFKHGLAWCKVKPTLEDGKNRLAPRSECFGDLWKIVAKIGEV